MTDGTNGTAADQAALTRALSPRAIDRSLERLGGWARSPNGLSKEYQFPTAEMAARFAGVSARRAASAGRPIDLALRGDHLTVAIQPAGPSLTPADFQFARRLDIKPRSIAG